MVLLVALLWAGLDQATKFWAEASLTRGESVPLVGELLQLHLTYNSGAAFSLGTSWTGVVTTIATLVSVGIVIQAFRTRSLGWALTLGLLLGGAVGNLIDRYLRPPSVGLGHVVDFLALPNFPVFNVADMGVTTAACLIVLLSLRGFHPDGTREGHGSREDEGAGAGAESTQHEDESAR
ncbi:Lipoprotein signal peptidase [Serinicoccus hydrothermalis]|uniref:Lipoprotein signal peptidase n=1 Tax=Serinicoccus hydrothermalis TaxID=1758689 RepID=A0A1B1NA30_9MICO|nr:signal peptidase II [Serinicoccus hydrothermalis]ANS78264.1 Lipoprotein signal peptidase [Serinicoccus hydrothermalis]